ncbi:MAG: hypothetical protein ABSE73_29435 [Planctomycetota bacterium]|jgi:hypothetical protein
MDVRPQEAQHLPALGLELVGLPGVVDALADAGVKFQAVGIKGGAIIDHETPRERRIVAVEK